MALRPSYCTSTINMEGVFCCTGETDDGNEIIFKKYNTGHTSINDPRAGFRGYVQFNEYTQRFVFPPYQLETPALKSPLTIPNQVFIEKESALQMVDEISRKKENNATLFNQRAYTKDPLTW